MNMHRKLHQTKRSSLWGFTLIELLVVILILGILAALIVPRVLNNVGKSKVAAATTDLATLSDGLNKFHLDCDRFPTSDEGLQALIAAPSDLSSKWHGPYIQAAAVPMDPWGNAYVYKSPGDQGSDSFTIVSYGADGAPGGTGDDADITKSGS